MQSLLVAAIMVTLFFSIHASMERDRYRSVGPEGMEAAYNAQTAAYEMGRRHSAAIQWRRERSNFTGELPEGQLEEYGFNEGSQTLPWVTVFYSNGVILTYAPLENLQIISPGDLASQVYSLNQNPYSGMTTSTGILNASGTINLGHNLPSGVPVIGDVVRD